jgi:ATP-dependent Clp protease protease subunit
MDKEEKEDLFRNTNDEIESKLFKSRRVLIFGGITDKLARDVTSRLLTLADESSAPIEVFINSPGGHVESGDTIFDVVRFVRSVAPLTMVGTGWVASAGAHIFLAAEKKRRVCLPNTRFMLHQPSGGAQGKSSDLTIEANEIMKMYERIIRITAEETGQPIEKVRADTQRNHWMSSEEAIAYGMVSKQISSIADLKALK